jgi:uncharacterized protein (DUF1800 family)
MDATIRALNRFGLGARSGEARTIDDPRAWLRAQLEGGPPVAVAPEGAFPTAIAEAIRGLQAARQANPQDRQQARRRLVELAAAEARAALRQRVTADRPFAERLVAFWSNHLCVSAAAKVIVAPLAGSYEREAIRPHVFGRFEDMVLASAKHPAMLAYLDNFQSIGPNSRGARAGQRNAGARRGLNENYARELLELHTLGVNGGYTQQDVQELARILTGWTIDGLGGPAARAIQRRLQRPVADSIAFTFREMLHEAGAKTVMGARYEQAGVAEGERVIRALCRHPSTARFVATKLVAHFVADDPPTAAVDRIARSFQTSGGDLKVVARALVDEPEAWREERRKFRTPQDWIVAVLRSVGATDVQVNLIGTLRQLRQPLWAPPSPKGFSDKMSDWADPDSLLNRAELARTLGARLPRQRTIDPPALVKTVDITPKDPLHAVAADGSIPIGERLALVMAGPAFQWR